jgi:mannose-6-phosphate isomerase-like protein (cupin superfamily)
MDKYVETPKPIRRPTPRPKPTNPIAIRRDEMAHHIWGDEASGYVSDRVISSTDQLHVLEFELSPGGEFRHSQENQTIFAADVLYFCVQGELILANPQTGEVVVVPSGSGCLFRRGTWHHGFNPGSTTTRVIEYFSPPPARGAASDFAKTQPPLVDFLYSRKPKVDRHLAASKSLISFWEVNDSISQLGFRDSKPSHLLASLVETEFLSVSKGTVYPGHVEEFADVNKESVIYVLEGELWVDVWSETSGFNGTTTLRTGEAMFLPLGCKERLLVRDHNTARYLIGRGSVPADWKA